MNLTGLFADPNETVDNFIERVSREVTLIARDRGLVTIGELMRWALETAMQDAQVTIVAPPRVTEAEDWN